MQLRVTSPGPSCSPGTSSSSFSPAAADGICGNAMIVIAVRPRSGTAAESAVLRGSCSLPSQEEAQSSESESLEDEVNLHPKLRS